MSALVQDDRAAEEAWLIARIGAGDRDAFRALYNRYSGPLYSLAVRIVGDRRDAEELLQDIFVKIWNNARSYDAAMARPFTWAVTIARRTCIDALRRRGNAAIVPWDDAGPNDWSTSENPAEASVASDEVARVRAAVAALPAAQKSVLELALFAGLPHVEIAARVGQPLGTVKSWIRRGLEQLREATARE